VTPEVPLLDVKEFTAVLYICRALTLEFEHKKSTIVPRGDKVDLGMSGKDPKTIFAPVSQKMRALGGIPNSNGLILAVTAEKLSLYHRINMIFIPDDKVMLWKKEYTADIVRVTTHGIDFPSLNSVSAGIRTKSSACMFIYVFTLLSPIRQSLMKRSSAPETIRGCTICYNRAKHITPYVPWWGEKQPN
jgi:hypothetical protein